MKIYIAGKITGDPYYKAKFARAAADIADAGHTPINPAMQPEGMSNADYMRISPAQDRAGDRIACVSRLRGGVSDGETDV